MLKVRPRSQNWKDFPTVARVGGLVGGAPTTRSWTWGLVLLNNLGGFLRIKFRIIAVDFTRLNVDVDVNIKLAL